MRVHVDDPSLVASLLAFLARRHHVTAARVDENQVEVSQLGSMNATARRIELDLMLQVWRAANDNARVHIL